MKTPLQYYFALLALLSFVSGCAAQTVVVSWTAPAVGNPTGYKFYVSAPGSTNWTVAATTAATSYTLPFLGTAYGERYFVTATNALGLESPPSNTATNLIPRSPENMKLNHNIALPN